MTSATSQSFDDIRAMLESGHQSVRLERHSFMVWGIGLAILIVGVEYLLGQADRLMPWQVASVGFVLLGLGVFIIASLDFTLTKRVRATKEGTVSFVQVQLTRLLWVIGLFVVSMYFALGLRNVGYIMYPVSIGALGLFFYVSGLFSRQPVSWVGLSLVVAAVLCAALPFLPQWQWVAASVYGVGLPLLGVLMGQKSLHASRLRQGGVTLGWLLVVFCVAIGSPKLFAGTVSVPAGPVVPLANYLAAPDKYASGETVIELPVGTKVPFKVSLQGNIAGKDSTASLIVRTKKPILIVLKDGKVEGRIKVGSRPWENEDTHKIWFGVQKMSTDFEPGKGPVGAMTLFLRY